ncbi:hypothetical protein LCP963914a_9630 [Penicillium roqueforti]|nr:hypothetical protein LCP963914a_9630 [Penicillium roqueforti]
MVPSLSFVIPFLPLVASFVHPGLLVSESDISRTQKKINASLDPWTTSWNTLTSLSLSDASYTPSAVSVVYRSAWEDNAANAQLLWHDVAAAFNLGLRWKISGNTSFADAASNILHAWATNLTAIGGGDDKYLTAGLQGYELANAAELLLDYQPFVDDVLPSVVEMANNIFIPMHYTWLNHEESSEHNILHFFANWELCNVASAMAMAVITDNQTVWDFAVNYFKNGDGTGAINNAITNIVEEPSTGTLLGQGQESGRDQGHSALDIQLLGVIGQQALNQGEDLFAYNDSRILRGTEYFARYNLGNDVPFVPYTNGIVSYTEISNASRGAIRPTWELLYNHYVVLKQLDAPWTTLYLNNSLEYYGGAEGGAGSWGEGSGHYDGLGWGSLLYHMDESDVVSASSSKAVLSTANPTPSASSATLSLAPSATTTTSGVSTQSSIVSYSTTTEFAAVSAAVDIETVASSSTIAVSAVLDTETATSSTIAANSRTSPSFVGSTIPASTSTDLPTAPLESSQKAHHHHQPHHYHVKGTVKPSPEVGAITLDQSSRDAIVSVGLAALSNVNNDRELRILSREKHVTVIKAVREVVENPTQANPDRTLHLIVMLSLYEMVSCTPNQLNSWIVHMNGAAALLKQSIFRSSLTNLNHRAHLQFYFVSIVKYFSKRVVTPDLLNWSPDLIPSAPPDILPDVDLVDILIRYTKFDAHVHHQKPGSRAVVNSALLFEDELREWETHLPIHWSFAIKEPNTYEHTFRGQYHVYANMWVARVFNHYRWARLLVNETIVSQISKMARPTADDVTYAPELQVRKLSSSKESMKTRQIYHC